MSITSQILPISINDIKDRYYDGLEVSEDEIIAIKNYDAYRIRELNSARNDSEFKLKYLKLQALANLSNYRHFLNTDLV